MRIKRKELSGLDEALEAQKSGLESAADKIEPVLRDVAEAGDEALQRYTEEFDGVEVDEIAVSGDEIDEAYGGVDDSFLLELEVAAENVGAFHADQLPPQLKLSQYQPGVYLGEKVTSIESAGCYVPGGRAAYPSSALMCVIPAAVAGVERIAVCTPPPVRPETVVAADLAGADEIYRVGGSQAIAALAYGTETVDPVDKIVGPGGAFVTAAKSLVRGDVEIDFPAGPSEVMIVADSAAEPDEVALDMAAQAEHGPDSLSVLVTTEPSLVDEVEERLEELLPKSPRAEILEDSLRRAVAVLVETVGEGIDAANVVAPEHLEIVVEDEFSALSRVRHAGAIFLGRYSPVAAGDYATGANHVLPTAGYAKRFGGLDTAHFLKRSSVQRLNRGGLELLEPTVRELADVEGFDMHARSVDERLRDD